MDGWMDGWMDAWMYPLHIWNWDGQEYPPRRIRDAGVCGGGGVQGCGKEETIN